MREPFVACAHADKCSAFTTMCIIENAPNPASKHRACRLGSHQLLSSRSRHLALRSRSARILSQSHPLERQHMQSISARGKRPRSNRPTRTLSTDRTHKRPDRTIQLANKSNMDYSSRLREPPRKKGDHHDHPENNLHRRTLQSHRGDNLQRQRGRRIPQTARLTPPQRVLH